MGSTLPQYSEKFQTHYKNEGLELLCTQVSIDPKPSTPTAIATPD
jgi:hypothetical protein